MRLGEYFEIGKRMKQVRTNAGISQRDMAGETGQMKAWDSPVCRRKRVDIADENARLLFFIVEKKERRKRIVR